MSSLRVFVCFLASASALTIRGDAPVDAAPVDVAPVDDELDDGKDIGAMPEEPNMLAGDEMDDVAADLTCPLVPDLPVSTLMSLADDQALDTEGVVEAAVAEVAKPKQAQLAPVQASSLKPLGETAKSANGLPKDADLTKFVDAVKDARHKKQEFMKSQAKLMAAMEGLLEVPAADRLFLAKAANGALGRDSLIVFYAPWCVHCQKFVLHDEKGNPRNAPLEVFRKDLAKDPETKDVAVARADITKIGDVIPDTFKIVGIPTVYFVNMLGEASKFDGNAHSPKDLKEFVRGLTSN